MSTQGFSSIRRHFRVNQSLSLLGFGVVAGVVGGIWLGARNFNIERKTRNIAYQQHSQPFVEQETEASCPFDFESFLEHRTKDIGGRIAH